MRVFFYVRSFLCDATKYINVLIDDTLYLSNID